VLTAYVLFSKRTLFKIKLVTPFDFLWRLKEITGKSEYEIFHIAAAEKGWPEYQVEKHFKKFLSDQTLPVYVKEFLEDGKEHISAYQSAGEDLFNKRLLVFYALLTILILGGSLFLSIYIIPKYLQYDQNDFGPGLDKSAFDK
jgi:hypothetical protein